MQVPVKYQNTGTFVLNEDMNSFDCNHEDAQIERACCDGAYDEDGRINCGCGGRDSVYCPAVDCEGIQDWEVDDIFEDLA